MMLAMKRVVVETVVPENFKYIARDQDGSVHVFEKKPNLDYGTSKNPLACDMWDVFEGETMQVSPKSPVDASRLTEELGDWRDSLQELNVLTSEDVNQ